MVSDCEVSSLMKMKMWNEPSRELKAGQICQNWLSHAWYLLSQIKIIPNQYNL
jgi:hypothetical protein